MLKHSAPRPCWWRRSRSVALALPAPAQGYEGPGLCYGRGARKLAAADRARLRPGDYELKSVPIDGEKYAILTLAGEPVLLDEGAPALPLVCRSAIIPDMAEMGLSVVSADFREYQVKNRPLEG